jgi:signal peptidase II
LSPAARGWIRAVVLGAGVFVLDQATKQLAAAQLDPGEHVGLALGFELEDVRNRGIAFGFFGEGEGLLIAVTAAALVLVLAYFALDPARRCLWIGVGLLVGGALGNLADRVRDGSVIDFLDPPAWPAFNLADAAIVVGIATMVLLQTGPREGGATSSQQGEES